jgi:hypothetical protein
MALNSHWHIWFTAETVGIGAGSTKRNRCYTHWLYTDFTLAVASISSISTSSVSLAAIASRLGPAVTNVRKVQNGA